MQGNDYEQNKIFSVTNMRFWIENSVIKRNLSDPLLLKTVPRLGWAPWNLSCLEFKFDDTRLSYWHKNKIGRIEKKMLLPDFANSLPCWLSQQNWASQQGRKLAKSGSNKKNFNSANLILMSIGKSGIIKFEFQTTY